MSLSKDAILYSWLEKVLGRKILKNLQLEVTGTSANTDGYIGDIVFAVVTGTTYENQEKIFNLVIKHGKINDHLRETIPIRAVFEMEIFLYDKVFPTFKKFEFEKDISETFNAAPKCFGTLLLDKMEVIVLEDLKKLGYELCDRKTPLNIHHIKPILKKYGQLHALSFALRDQRKEEFETLAATVKEDFMTKIMNDKKSMASIEVGIAKAKKTLRDDDLYLFEKYRKLLGEDAGEKLLEIVSRKEPQSAILHGDCWGNNFMYKYKDSDRTSPSNVAILDWQMSSLRSPVIDLSYLIYVTGSKEEFAKFNELIDEYYTSFSSYLRKLGSDPEKLFPFSALKTHWKIYGMYGLIVAPHMLSVVLCDKDNAPKLEDLKGGEDLTEAMDFKITETERFRDRFIAVLDHYFNYEF